MRPSCLAFCVWLCCVWWCCGSHPAKEEEDHPKSAHRQLSLNSAAGNLGGWPSKRPRQACLFVFLVFVQLLTVPAFVIRIAVGMLAGDICDESVEGAPTALLTALLIFVTVML